MPETKEPPINAEQNLNSPENSRPLTLWQMILLGKGSLSRKIIHLIISIALRLFFRRIETANAENVPPSGALIFVVNHPNGLIDPALIYVSLVRRVSFLAKSTLFSIPIGGWLLRQLEALPVYRQIDAANDASKNLQTFEVCQQLLNRGRCIAIFPEGISHDQTKLQPIKTGAARIALGATALREIPRVENVQSDIETQSSDEEKSQSELSEVRNSSLNVKIMAVGLYYTSKTAFRSEALIRYGEIFDVPQIELDENGEPPRDEVKKLTDKIKLSLENATLNFESARELDAVLKAEALFSSVYENLLFKETLMQTFQRLQDLAKRYALLEKNDPEKMRRLNEKISAYENDLQTSGVTTESLSVLQHPTWYVFRYLILRLVILLIFLPFSIIGVIIHAPAFAVSNFVGQMFKTHGADVAGSTYKILGAIVLMPLTWGITALIILWFFGWQIALVSIPATIFCGYVALRSSETLIDLAVWIKALWLLFRQRALFLRLLIERETLQKEIGEIVEK